MVLPEQLTTDLGQYYYSDDTQTEDLIGNL